MRIVTNQQGSIAILGAVLLAVLIGMTAMAVEMGNWYVTRVDAQRMADMGAISGAFAYAAKQDPQTAAQAAADAAEVNGAKGGSRNWDAGAQTLTDDHVVVEMVDSPRNAANKAVQVAVSVDVPVLLAQVITSVTTVTIRGSSWAEIATTSGGGTACILALSKTSSNGIDATGNPTLDLNGCSLRSNCGISVGGSASVTAAAAYAACSISGPIVTTPTAGQTFDNQGVIADPYAGNSALQSAFEQLGSGGSTDGDKPADGTTLSPGTYTDFDFKNSVTLEPGLYIVNGSVTINAQATVTGTGVTIVSSGAVKINGGATIDLSAPVDGASSGVPGVVLADNGSGGSKINGGSSSAFEGALYFPNDDIEFTGNSANGSNGCTQVVANTVSFKGGATLGSSCTKSGTTPINNTNSSQVNLVQ